MKILILNGVNMNMLGVRNVSVYGSQTLDEVNATIRNHARNLNAETQFVQSNCEGTLVDVMQQTDADAIILNAGAYSHYSYALRDCIEGLTLPVVEVHMSDIYQRETFRHNDVLADVCKARFYGKGVDSYLDALYYLCGVAR